MLVEICANSYQSAINAELGGADRIELCTELSVGGVTPSYALIDQVVAKLTIPVYVLIRPRSGGFDYSQAEMEQMIRDIEICGEIGCAGIVSGALTSHNEIDIQKTKQLLKASAKMDFTYHRAIDISRDALLATKQIAELGIKRILSSGAASKAIDGLDTLVAMQSVAMQHDMIIMPGSGVNAQNCLAFNEAGFTEIHTSASSVVGETGAPLFSTTHKETSVDIVREIVNKLTDPSD